VYVNSSLVAETQRPGRIRQLGIGRVRETRQLRGLLPRRPGTRWILPPKESLDPYLTARLYQETLGWSGYKCYDAIAEFGGPVSESLTGVCLVWSLCCHSLTRHSQLHQ